MPHFRFCWNVAKQLSLFSILCVAGFFCGHLWVRRGTYRSVTEMAASPVARVWQTPEVRHHPSRWGGRPSLHATKLKRWPYQTQLRDPKSYLASAKMWSKEDEERVAEWEKKQLQSVLNDPAAIARLAEADDLIFKARIFLAYEAGRLKADMLTDDFVFVSPIVGPFGKEAYLNALGGLFFQDAFPGANSDNHHFRVDPFDPYRVLFTQRGRGPQARETEPQSCSLRFDKERRGKVNQMTVGYTMFENINLPPVTFSRATQVSLDRHFPGSLPGPTLHKKLVEILSEYGFTRDNTILGTSLCPDEVNSVKGTLAYTMQEYWGNRFRMGGLGGPPSAGKTGYFAFSHHVPEDGNVMVLFGPHMGITDTGEVGKCLREGQLEASSCCGACAAALSQLRSGMSEEGLSAKLLLDLDPLDVQQSMLRRAIAPHLDRINRAEDESAEMAKVTYEWIEKMMLEIAHTGFGPGNLALIGGILLNMPIGYPDYFMPLHFTIQKQQSGPTDILYKLKDSQYNGPSVAEPVQERITAVSDENAGFSPEQIAFLERKKAQTRSGIGDESPQTQTQTQTQSGEFTRKYSPSFAKKV